MESARERLVSVLEAILRKNLASPGDVAAETGLPRYYVLSVFQCLEALGVIEPAYVRGSYKLYAPTSIASAMLRQLRELGTLNIKSDEAAIGGVVGGEEGVKGAAPQNEEALAAT
ncbi:MAG: hypothetical protein ABWW70_04970 [Thermoproteota archaeon]